MLARLALALIVSEIKVFIQTRLDGLGCIESSVDTEQEHICYIMNFKAKREERSVHERGGGERE